ncbi:Ig-like domain-containing protein [Candidatus Latescibacterota bacterium]
MMCRERKSQLALLSLIAGMLVYVSCGDRERANPLDPDRPGAEEGFGLTAVGATNGVQLGWSEMSFPKFDRYVVYRRPSGSQGDFQQVATSSTHAYLDSGLVDIVEYEYQLTVINDGNESRRSNSVRAAPLDGASPTVAIIYPLEGQRVSGRVSIVVEAADNVGVTEVEFSVDGGVVLTRRQAPYVYVWDVTNLENGSTHSVRAIARDQAGNEPAVDVHSNVTVDNSTPVVSEVTMSDPSPVAGGTLVFQIHFSTDMDLDQDPLVSFGRATPFDEHTVLGSWEDTQVWVGSIVVTSATGDGDYTLRVDEAVSLTGNAQRLDETATFVIDTTPPEQLVLSIDGSADFTNTPGVALALGAADVTSDVTDMMISNDPSLTDAGWEPFVETKSWNLEEGDGAKTVYARVRDAAGNESVRVQSEIFLITQAPVAVSLEDPRDTTPVSTTLVWSESNNVFFAGYRVYRSSDAGVSTEDELIATVSDVTTTTYTDQTLEPEVQYFYRVYVFDQSDLSTGSNEVEATTTSTRSITGDVTDVLTGGLVSGAEISLTPGEELLGRTETNGAYVVTGFPSGGDYTLRVTAANYLPTVQAVTIPAQGILGLDIALRPEPSVSAPVNTGSYPFSIPQYIALSPDGDRAYVTNFRSEQMSVVSVANNTVVGSVFVGQSPMGVVANPVSGQVYVANSFDNSVSVVDVASLAEEGRVQVGAFPQGLAIADDGTILYVVNKGDGTVSVVDLDSREIVANVSVGRDPMWAALVPGTELLFVTNNSANTVSVVDTDTRQVTETLFVGAGPEGVAASPDGRRVYVANSFDNSVSVIDVASLTVIKTLEVGAYPRHVAFSPEGDLGGLAYVSNFSDSNVSIIDVTNDEVLSATLTVGNFPVGLVVLENGRRIYVVNDVNSSITVIDY